MRGLKRGHVLEACLQRVSHPTRVRGLKLKTNLIYITQKRSHPTRVRGLKLDVPVTRRPHDLVAPHAGAWIETAKSSRNCGTRKSHPTRVRGLKLEALAYVLSVQNRVAPLAGAWIETPAAWS